ncbi:YbaB/EbfC family nucleoid-associated protein [Micromonospora psammae]|uniref:YbaB/EbfC family nucleoid-associated protein n=1 Tax=Micromonospora sp. CPCC 205556 TaxID=3122398 RepID=UPI003FA60BEC
MFGRDLGDAEQWVAEWSASISERAERTQRLASRVAGTSAMASSPDGLVEVRVDSGGALSGLHLDNRITGWPASRVEALIIRTMRQAQAKLVAEVAAAVAETVGADTETGRAVLEGYSGRFGVEPDGPDPDGGRRAG